MRKTLLTECRARGFPGINVIGFIRISINIEMLGNIQPLEPGPGAAPQVKDTRA